MALIDKLVNVKISISAASVSTQSFDKLMLIGALPVITPEEAPPEFGVYGSLGEVQDAGWKINDKVYAGAAIAFANGADTVYICPRQTSEDIDVTLARASKKSGWYGLAVVDLVEDEIETVATWAEANEKMFGYTVGSYGSLLTTTNFRTFGCVSKSIEKNPNNAYMNIALFVKACEFRAGGETWCYKTLSGIVPDDWSGTEMTNLENAKANYYTECAGKAITLGGKTASGEWIDVVRFRDWLKAEIQTNVYGTYVKNPKVPYTDGGIALIRQAIVTALITGQQNGGISPTEFDGDGDEIPGFTVTVPLAANCSDVDKANRRLRNVVFHARLAGAIHATEIVGTLVE